MVKRRAFHQAVLLANGEVLLAGGLEDLTPLVSAEFYDPSSAPYPPPRGPLNLERFDAASVPLSDGRVLIAGGNDAMSSLDTAKDLQARDFDLHFHRQQHEHRAHLLLGGAST